MPFGKVTYTEVISKSEGQAAVDAAAGKIDPVAAEKELHEQKEWNNPYEDERRRAEELKKQAQKVRNKKTKKKKEDSNAGSGGFSDWMFFRALADAISMMGGFSDNEESGVYEGEIVPEQPALKAPKAKEKIDPEKVIDGKAWPIDETVLDRIKRKTPDRPIDRLPKANQTKAGYTKKSF